MLNHNSLMEEVIPLEFYLSQNYPNPFKKKTAIKYCVAYKTRVSLTVYNSKGEEIEKLIDEEQKPGTYEVEFNAEEKHLDPSEQSETFYYCLEARGYKCEKKMLLIK